MVPAAVGRTVCKGHNRRPITLGPLVAPNNCSCNLAVSVSVSNLICNRVLLYRHIIFVRKDLYLSSKAKKQT